MAWEAGGPGAPRTWSRRGAGAPRMGRGSLCDAGAFGRCIEPLQPMQVGIGLRRRFPYCGENMLIVRCSPTSRCENVETHWNYRTQMWDKQKEVFLPSTPGLGMHVEVKDPEGKVVLSRQYGSEGRFTFTSHTPGDHQICLHSNSTRMVLFTGGRLRVHLDIQVGEHANNYPEIAAKDKLTELQLRARQLLDQVEQIQKEQDYQRYREERFRLTSESTNQRVLWWSITQTVILILTGIWQMRHLKSFFEAKKLV
ncbi:transmembrane emp24 domain-containing protein 4 isoform 1-T1 [Molossus nigricans]